MRKNFGDLRIGEKFYPPLKDGRMDLRIMLIKISSLSLIAKPHWETKTTQNVVLHNSQINAVIIESPQNETTGYFDFVPNDTMVYLGNLDC